MPTASEALTARLLGDYQVYLRAGDRVFPLHPDEPPIGDYICYHKVAGGGGKGLNRRNTTQSYMFRVECYSTTLARAEALLQDVIVSLSTWVDRANGVQGCFDAEDQDADLEPDGGGGDYRVAGQTFELWYQG